MARLQSRLVQCMVGMSDRRRSVRL